MERREQFGKIFRRRIFLNGLELGAERVEAVKNNCCATERRRTRFERQGNAFRMWCLSCLQNAYRCTGGCLRGLWKSESRAHGESMFNNWPGMLCSEKNPRCPQAFENKELILSLSSPCVHITHSLPNSFSPHILEENWYNHNLLVNTIH